MAQKKETKKVESKAAPKAAAKKPEPKKDVKKPGPAKEVKKPAPVAKKEEKAKPTFRTYHVVKRPDDGKWEVKFAGGAKAIKLFNTQAEALEYSKKMAENQDGKVLVHNSKGKNKGRIKSK